MSAGLTKNQDNIAVMDDRLSRAGLREQLVNRILTAVFERRFPSGSRLVVQRVAERFGVSPTPVREALVELAGLGIVELLPNRGAVVKAFGAKELGHISQVRRVLEMEACRSACGRISRDDLEEIRSRLRRLRKGPQNDAWDRDARAADSRLHILIADHCGNPRLAQEIRQYLLLFRAIRNISHLRDSWENYRRSNDVPEHLQIVDAMLGKDPERAAKCMDRHVRSITAVLNEVVFPARPADAAAVHAMTDRRVRR